MITIIGAGSWGTTMAVHLAKKGLNVQLHSVFKEHNLDMIKFRENKPYLAGVKFPDNLRVRSSLKESLENDVLVIAIPVKFLRKILKRIKRQNIILNKKIFVSLSKGIEARTFKRPSQMIEEELDIMGNIVVLSGPNLAKEISANMPAVSIIASKNILIAKKLQAIFNTPMFRVYTHYDVVGVELGGALKNIIAIACGVSDGLGFGVNTKAALVSRGLAEIIRLGQLLGAQKATFMGISGIGDLMATCFSNNSRNHMVGERIGKGESLRKIVKEMDMVAEGVETVKAVYKLSLRLKVDMPITKEVYKVLYARKPPRKSLLSLMDRPVIEE